MTDVNKLLSSLNDQDSLQHYGVIGMKWGVRRSDAELAASAQRKKQAKMDKLEVRDRKATVKSREAEARQKIALAKKTEKEVKKELKNEKAEARKQKLAESEAARVKALKDQGQTDTKYKDVKKLSDDELRTIVNRLNQEQQYKKLNPKPVSELGGLLNQVGSTAKLLKTVTDAAGGANKLYPKLSPSQASQISAVLTLLGKLDKK